MERNVYINLFSYLYKEYSRKVMCVWNGEDISSVIGSHSIGRYYRAIHFILEDCIIIFNDLLINLFQYSISIFTSTKVALYFENIYTRHHNMLMGTGVTVLNY